MRKVIGVVLDNGELWVTERPDFSQDMQHKFGATKQSELIPAMQQQGLHRVIITHIECDSTSEHNSIAKQ